MESRIEKYRMENAQLIAANNLRAANEDKASRYQLEMEKKQRRDRTQRYREELGREERDRAEERRKVLEEMAHSEKSAAEILKEHEKVASSKQDPALSTPVDAAQDHVVAHPYWSMLASKNLAKPETPFDPLHTLYVDEPEEIFDLEAGYSYDPLDAMDRDPVATAGGFRASLTIQKALRSAFQGLFVGVQDDEVDIGAVAGATDH